MLDGFDFLSGAFIGPRGPGKDATPGEQVAAGIAQLLFPTLIFCLVAFAGLWQHGTVVLVGTSLLCIVSYVISRYLSDSLSFAMLNALFGALWSFAAAAAGFLLGALVGFYSAF